MAARPTICFSTSRVAGFLELSGVSGFDSEADGRVVALLDYDRDGYQDLAVVNANAPRLELFRNRLGDLRRTGESDAGVRKNVIAVRTPSQCGARLELRGLEPNSDDPMRWSREVHCGEGFAAQNSSTELFGLGESRGPFELTIRWPSGETKVVSQIEAGTLIDVGILGGMISRSRY